MSDPYAPWEPWKPQVGDKVRVLRISPECEYRCECGVDLHNGVSRGAVGVVEMRIDWNRIQHRSHRQPHLHGCGAEVERNGHYYWVDLDNDTPTLVRSFWAAAIEISKLEE